MLLLAGLSVAAIYAVAEQAVYKGIHLESAVGNSSKIFASEAGIEVSEETQNLMNDLNKEGLAPVAVSPITRDFFSVEGKILTAGKDNIHVFEYPNKGQAELEASFFKRSSETRRGEWKKGVNLFLRNNLIIFYAGEKEPIIKALLSAGASKVSYGK